MGTRRQIRRLSDCRAHRAPSAPTGRAPKSGSRADSHSCGPEVLDWCRANGVNSIFGVAPTPTLRRRVQVLEASTKARFEAAPGDGKVRRFKEFLDGAQSWSRRSGSSPGSKSARKGPMRISNVMVAKDQLTT